MIKPPRLRGPHLLATSRVWRLARLMDVTRTVVLTNFAPHAMLAAYTVIAAPATAHAEAPIEASGLLADPVRLARRLHDLDPLVASAQARVVAAAASGQQARVHPNPQFSAALGGLVIGRGNQFGGQIGPTGFAQTTNISLGISELVELGKRAPRAAAADARTAQAGEQAVAALGARLGDAIVTLGKLGYVTARRDLVAVNLAAARRLRDLERVRLEHQDLAPVEFERIELDTRALEIQLRRAESDVATALTDCSTLLQAACGTAGLDVAALDAAAALPPTLPELTAAIEARPERIASKREIQALSWDAALAERRAIPDPTLGVSYTHDTYQYSGSAPNTVMVSIGIPLPLFDRGEHDAAAALATAHAIESEDRAAVREASGLVEALLAKRTALGATLAQLETDDVPASTRIIEQTRRAFDLGQARLADLLLVERAHRDLLLDVLDTRFELFGIRGQLRQAIGLDDEIARGVTGGSHER